MKRFDRLLSLAIGFVLGGTLYVYAQDGPGPDGGGGSPGGSTFATQYRTASSTFGGAGPGSAGQVLTSNGALAAPTFQAGASSSGANPTASVGLTAVNGVATTFLRSDGAPALDQAITPNWTGTHIFGNATTALNLQSASPRWIINKTGGLGNGRYWDATAAAGSLTYRSCNDAVSSCVNWLTVNRSTSSQNISSIVLSAVGSSTSLFQVDTLGGAFSVGLPNVQADFLVGNTDATGSAAYQLGSVSGNRTVLQAYGASYVGGAPITGAPASGTMGVLNTQATGGPLILGAANIGGLQFDGTTAAMSGLTKLTTLASATGGAGFNLPHGAAPSSPVNGDCWTTTSGLLCRINGATVGPYAAAGATQTTGNFTATYTDGFTTNVTQVINYVQTGSTVTLRFTAAASGTSDSTGFITAAGDVPVAIRPAGNINGYGFNATDNGVGINACIRINTDGSIGWYAVPLPGGTCQQTGWTAAGTKTLPVSVNQNVFTYSLN